ncbi:MAG: DNA-directed DNA polymerase II small subunit [Thermoplasmata archaeon]|nr:DNA-directed DNA polymerase II small subunit [Thermoplasmata archaeon]
MQRKVLDLFTSRGILVTAQAGERLLDSKDPLSNAEQVLAALPEGTLFLTHDVIDGILGPSPPPPKEEEEVQESPVSAEPPAGGEEKGGERNEEEEEWEEKGEEADIELGGRERGGEGKEHPHLLDLNGIPDGTADFPARGLGSNLEVTFDITGCSTSSGDISGFQHYFKDRYSTLREMIRKHRGYSPAAKISQLDPHAAELRLIGMVKECSTTKAGNKMVDLEDDTGVITVFIPKDSDLARTTLVHDEVIGVAGKRDNRGGLRAEEIVFPDIPIGRKRKKAEYPVAAAFCSDIHVGSDTFLGEAWKRFVEFMRGSGGDEEWAGLIKYLVVAGDLVDGIGIYPKQEEELVIHDIGKQYEELARLFSYLPDHLEIILMPGNHDAVRPAEPQPALAAPLQEIFTDHGVNARFLSNPSSFSLEGVKVLAYHGRSMDDLLSAVPGLTYEHPLEAMRIMLQRRHMAPIYGSKTPLAPENEDHMIIRDIPDIFVTGHVHSAGMELYRGVLLINSSTWQDQTSYQKMHNFNPVPAKLPVVNLQSLECRVFDFL